MLHVSNVSKSFGADSALCDITFTLPPAGRAGLIGVNGSGKSTLLRVIAGELRPDEGSVRVDPPGSVAYLPQYPVGELHLSIRSALLRGAGQVGRDYGRLAHLEQSLYAARGEELEAVLLEYATVRDRFEALGGYTLDAHMEEVLDGLRLRIPDLDATVETLSGGNKTKLSLARLLMSRAELLLLDEPTNFLDLPALLWLESFVRESESSYLIVSHDRRFLDRTIEVVLEIDDRKHTLRQWSGTYSDYHAARSREQQKVLAAYRDQQAEIARIEEDIRRTKEQAHGVEARTKSGPGADHERRIAKKVAHKAKARERRLERNLELHAIEKPKQSWGLQLTGLENVAVNRDRMVMEAVDVRASHGDRGVLAGVDLVLRGHDRTAVLGENGSGKSTLLRCVAGTLPYAGTIRLGDSIRLGYLSQESEELPLHASVLDVFRSGTQLHEDEARTCLHKFLFSGNDVFKPVGALSFGQRAKLALSVLIMSGANFLLLDEPTGHMDMPALSAIERALAEFEGPLLVVSHDRYFIERIGINRIEVMEEGTLRAVTSLEAYEQRIAPLDMH